ncbi:sugar-binding transcriptional regulator [Seohaeicola nanhaiensis]|uniref:Sugar-binding transcriptional regulator n=1 Tax=Seohaeicola nanhaiensis TaxID=1387282 RepID=A0ABV9KEX4_9RHOB
MSESRAAPTGPVSGRSGDTDRMRARAVWLYYAEGMKQSEIATALGTTRVAVVRLLADARRRNEVRITISAPLAELARLETSLSSRFGIAEVILCPSGDGGSDPTLSIAAAAGAHVSGLMKSGMSVGVGWGRTLHSMLPFIEGRTLEDVRIISLLGGISAARRFNPAEFAWRFAELFQGEGYLVPAPALVDSAETRAALIERCGIGEVFEMAAALDMALISVGGIAAEATSFRTGHLSEAERRDLIGAGAVGDVFYNFIDAEGRVIDHAVNARTISVDLADVARARERVLISGGAEKVAALRGAITALKPTCLVTDEKTAEALLAGA